MSTQRAENRELTLGEKRVAWNFNPNENPLVRETKTMYAKIIDDLEAARNGASQEKNRTISRAQTYAEDACMLTVKSLFQ
jgi:hypothetical protein